MKQKSFILYLSRLIKIFNTKHRLKKSEGFTLIELLVVIAIIGLLSSITLVAVKNVRERAEIAAGLQFSASIYHALETHLLGNWPFDSKIGNITKDISGNNADGTLIGNADITSGGEGIKKEALNIPSGMANDYVTANGNKLNSNSGSITLEAWIKPSSSYFYGGPIQKTGSYYLRVSSGTYRILFMIMDSPGGYGSVYSQDVADSLKINKWNHVVGTYDMGKSIKIYLNGRERGIEEHSGNRTIDQILGVYKNSNLVYLGKVSTGDFNAYVDEIKIYDVSLSSAQIKKLYVEGAKKRGLLSNK